MKICKYYKTNEENDHICNDCKNYTECYKQNLFESKEEPKFFNKYLWYPIYRIWYKITLIPQNIKFFFQRRIRGFDDRVNWDLGVEMLKWLAPRLERWIKKGIEPGQPINLTQEEWKGILKKILWLAKHPEDYFYKDNRTEKGIISFHKKQKEACELLGKYLLQMWD